MKVERPKFVSVPLATGLKWRGGAGWRYEEKMDGVWSQRELVFGVTRAIVIGEQMKDGRFFTFDLMSIDEIDLRPHSLSKRLEFLEFLEVLHIGSGAGPMLRPAVGHGAEFLEAVLARGGEGVVAKQLDAPFGAEWWKCKRLETFDLIVTDKREAQGSIRIGELNGEDRGWCPCKAQFNSVAIGDIVEIEAFGLTASGKLREPRFKIIRNDKAI